MHPRRHSSVRGQVLVLALILLALLGGGAWYLFRSKGINEQAARAFAQEAAERILLHQDARFLDRTIASESQVIYPPSFRERLLIRIRDLGTPEQKVELTGRVTFTSGFFNPQGQFRAQINYSENPAFLDLAVSHPRALWQIDGINLIWTPHVEPTPPPATPAPSVQPTPSPSPEKSPPADRRKKKHGRSR